MSLLIVIVLVGVLLIMGGAWMLVQPGKRAGATAADGTAPGSEASAGGGDGEAVAVARWLLATVVGMVVGAVLSAGWFGISVMGLFLFGWPSFSDSEQQIAQLVAVIGGGLLYSGAVVLAQWHATRRASPLMSRLAPVQVVLTLLALTPLLDPRGFGDFWLLSVGLAGLVVPLLTGPVAWGLFPQLRGRR